MSDPLKLQDWIARFIAHLVQRNLSHHTRSNYARDLATLREFCAKQGVTD